ncbi:hypothetical protein [Candidatus Albibeggiatoa sp. nov. NOAA]|uniref:hypothetical protein n=1 Tax=Candidatus Albibeggiatoa sp. nov. NOAA TaxID=3162724 RepID=UPI0032F7076F|nr:hypothetical protein [Thiotrichaceae bacterium]
MSCYSLGSTSAFNRSKNTRDTEGSTMLQLDLNNNIEQRLIQIAHDNGYNVKDWVTCLLNGLLEHEELLEDLEDIIAADQVRKAINSGEEETYSLQQVERHLGL